MDRFLTLDKKKALIVLIAIIAAFLAISTLLYLNNNKDSKEETVDVMNAEQAEVIEQLPATAQAAQDSYDNDIKEIVSQLKSGKWQAGSGSDIATITFEDKVYVEAGLDKSQETHAYAIMSAVNSEDGKTTLALATEEGNYIATLTTSQDENGDTINTIACNAFANSSSEYTQVPDDTKFTVNGPNQEYAGFIGKSIADIQSAISKYCTANHPYASSASWDEEATIDWSNGNVATTFELDDDSSISLTYKTETGDISIEENN